MSDIQLFSPLTLNSVLLNLNKITEAKLWGPLCAVFVSFSFVSVVIIGERYSKREDEEKKMKPPRIKKQKSELEGALIEDLDEVLQKILDVAGHDEERLLQLELDRKDIASILSSEMPSCGLKEVFLSVTPTKGNVLSNSPTSQRYRLRDLVTEVQTKMIQQRQVDNILQRYISENKKYEEENQLLQSQLKAEEQLRINAEDKSSLMQKELERLHRIKSEHNIEREELRQRIQQTKMELDLIDASRSDSDESTKKVQNMVAEMQADHAKTKEEVQNLRGTNKSLVQKLAHERQRREQLLREISDLKVHVLELTPKTVNIMEDSDKAVGFSKSSAMRLRPHMTPKFQNEEEYEDLDEEEFGGELGSTDEDERSVNLCEYFNTVTTVKF